MPKSSLLVLSVIIFSVGCGGARQAELAKGQARLGEQLQELVKSQQTLQRSMMSMKDRLALLEDRLEAQAIHRRPLQHQIPRLPVVQLGPQPVHGRRGIVPPMAVGPIGQRDLEVLRAGPRAMASRSALAVRAPTQPEVKSSEPKRRTRRRRAVAPPANAAGAGNIGVVPLSPRTPRAVSTAVASAPPAPETGPLAAWKQAQAIYKMGDMPRAIPALETFAKTYPRHGYADNALFLVGRARFDRVEYASALRSFRGVVERYPTGNKVPDALLMIGLSLQRLGQLAEGRETLSRLVAMFPQTEAARKATAALRGS